jgi:hypothetical protein
MVIQRLNPQRTIVSLSERMTSQKHKYWFGSLNQWIYYILVNLQDLDYSHCGDQKILPEEKGPRTIMFDLRPNYYQR